MKQVEVLPQINTDKQLSLEISNCQQIYIYTYIPVFNQDSSIMITNLIQNWVKMLGPRR